MIELEVADNSSPIGEHGNSRPARLGMGMMNLGAICSAKHLGPHQAKKTDRRGKLRGADRG